MKKALFLFTAAVVLMAVSCQQELPVPETVPEAGKAKMVFKAYSESGTKTELSGTSVLWSEGDRISLFCDSDYENHMLESNVSEPSAIADFTAEIADLAPEFIAVYPYDEDYQRQKNNIVMTLPNVQTAVPDSFDPAAFPSFARSSNRELRFYNLCGGLKLRFSQEGIGLLKISSNNGEPIAGEVNVVIEEDSRPSAMPYVVINEITFLPPEGEKCFSTSCDYFVSLLPGVLEDGLTFHFENSEGFSLGDSQFGGRREIKRSVFANPAGFDEDATLEYPEPGLVDLGLSVCWADSNLGASSYQEDGYYFAWGETIPKYKYSWNNYMWGSSSSSISKYGRDGNMTLDPEDDAATVLLGENWRMPTTAEINELIDGCTWMYHAATTGYILRGTSKSNPSAYIEFHSAGLINGISVAAKNDVVLWSSDIYSSSQADRGSTFYWQSSSSKPKAYFASRFNGVPVRPVFGNKDAVATVSLDKTELKIFVGKSKQLTATVLPATATDKYVSWTSSDEQVATVDGDGLVSGIGAGTATITATTRDGGKTATCSVTVEGMDVEIVEHDPDSWFTDIEGTTYNTIRCFLPTPEKFIPGQSGNDDVTDFSRDLKEGWKNNRIDIIFNGSLVTDGSVNYKFVFSDDQPKMDGRKWILSSDGSSLKYDYEPVVTLAPNGKITYVWAPDPEYPSKVLLNKWSPRASSPDEMLYCNVDLVAYVEDSEDGPVELYRETMHVRFMRPVTFYFGAPILYDNPDRGEATTLGKLFGATGLTSSTYPNGFQLLYYNDLCYESCYYPDPIDQTTAQVYWYNYYDFSSMSIDIDGIKTFRTGDDSWSWVPVNDIFRYFEFWVAPANDLWDSTTYDPLNLDISNPGALNDAVFVGYDIYPPSDGYDSYFFYVPISVTYAWGVVTQHVLFNVILRPEE